MVQINSIDKAISIIDAVFSRNNLNQHKKHAAEMGLSKRQYANNGKELSEAKPGGNIIQYTRPDGRQVKLNIQTKEYVVYKGNTIITHYILKQSQFERAMRHEY